MLTSKILIERLNHYEQENKELTERIEFYQRKTQRLEKRNKEIYEGFKATIQELCDTTKELEDYKSRCEKANKLIMSKHNWYGDEEEDNEEYLFELEDFEELLNIINGNDE